MTVVAKSVVLSARARQDFVSILRHTGRQWGAKQVEIYSDTLDAAIERIAQNPKIGIARTDLKQPYRTFPAGTHLIIYRFSASQIRVLRILHQRMDPISHD